MVELNPNSARPEKNTETSPMPPPDELEEVRSEIDRIDTSLVEQFNRRVALAIRAGEIKRESGESVVYRPERESRILRGVLERSSGEMDNETLLHVFREIISACRGAESRTTVSVLGPEGTFCQAAAIKHFGHQIQTCCSDSIEDIFRQVEISETDYGVVPVENSTEGSISNTLDALQDTTVTICGEINLAVRHCLLSRSENTASLVEVLAHAQALGQCRRWLSTNLPGISLRPVSSNAEAARLAGEDPHRAAIAGESVAGLYGLDVLAHGIQDSSDNTTRFLVLSRRPIPSSGNDKTSVLLSASNRPGSLYDLLHPLARHKISMNKIESRPAPHGLWEYVFFVDVIGHRDDPVLAEALVELEQNAALYRHLGSYPVAV